MELNLMLNFVYLAVDSAVLAAITYFLVAGYYKFRASKMWIILLFGIWLSALTQVVILIIMISS